MTANHWTTKRLLDVALATGRDPAVFGEVEQYHALHERVKVFEAAIWFPHLQAQVNATNRRGMEGHCRDINVMTWCCAGRCLIQLERGETTITLITADDEKPWVREMAYVAPSMGPMGIQSIDGDYLDILSLLYLATRHGQEITLQPNDAVTIA